MKNLIKNLGMVLFMSLLTACSSTAETAKLIIEQLEFDEGEEGCITLNAQIDLNPVPLLSSNAMLIYKKRTSEDAPDC